MSKTLTVEGMTCSGCEHTVKTALESIAGIERATPDRDANQVTVEGDADIDSMLAAVEDAGYTASAR